MRDGPSGSEDDLEVAMAALAKAMLRASGTQVDVETLKTLGLFWGTGLAVSLLLAMHALDVSAGFL
jgi:hypothetical protein